MADATINLADFKSAKLADLQALARRCESDDPAPEDLAELRRVFAGAPEIVRREGDLGVIAERALVAQVVGKSQFAVTFFSLDFELRRAELGYDGASPLEKMLIEAVVLAWARYCYLEKRYSSVLSESHSLAQGEFWQKQVSGAQRRYLRSIETLARVRRLALPALQINVADQQINQVNIPHK